MPRDHRATPRSVCLRGAPISARPSPPGATTRRDHPATEARRYRASRRRLHGQRLAGGVDRRHHLCPHGVHLGVARARDPRRPRHRCARARVAPDRRHDGGSWGATDFGGPTAGWWAVASRCPTRRRGRAARPRRRPRHPAPARRVDDAAHAATLERRRSPAAERRRSAPGSRPRARAPITQPGSSNGWSFVFLSVLSI